MPKTRLTLPAGAPATKRLEVDVLLLRAREEGLPRLLDERDIHALPLRQPVRDDRVAVKEIVRGPLLMAAFSKPPIGLKVLLDCFDGE